MPDLSHVMPWLVAFAGTAVGGFVLAVILDDVLGIAVAIKAGKFDWNALPSFLESEFGTRAAAALLGLVVTAAVAAAAGNGDIRAAALAALTAGATAKAASVVSDAVSKARQLIA